MATNYPYAYLHKRTSTHFEMGVIVNAGYYKITNELENSSLRTLAFEKRVAPTGQSVDEYYPVSDAIGDAIEFRTSVENGTPNDNRATTFYPSDFEWDSSPLPATKRYLPHSYLVTYKSNPVTPYKLYLAVPYDRFRYYKVQSENIDPSNNTRTIIIEEVQDPSRHEGGVWYESTSFFARKGAKEAIQIVVKEYSTARTKGKGTVRHSSADIKPFDLGDL